jgi:pyroglutamyl-peptidase
MTTVLLTGFEPFAGDTVNPSGEAVRLVAARWDGPETLITAVLPVTFTGAADTLEQLIAAHAPDVVIATGLAGGRSEVSVERVAINLIDARIPDNAGAQPIDAPSVDGAPSARFSTLPVKAIVRDATAGGIPTTLSTTAGTFVCNHTFFVAAEAAAHRPGLRAGFIHVPWADRQGGTDGGATLPLSEIARAISIAVRTTLDTPVDVHAVDGSLH